MTRRLQLEGQKVGRLTVVECIVPATGLTLARCVCDCGTEKTVHAYLLSCEKIQSCGCLRSEAARAGAIVRNTTHGQRNSRAYAVWHTMRQRCENPKDKDYGRYGGHGVSVCERWRDFQNFYDDMGAPPSGQSLDRIDNDGDYEPNNCRWASATTQARNRRNTIRVTYRGKTQPLAEWADLTGISYNTLWQRLKKQGWAVGRTLTAPTTTYRSAL